MGFKFRKSIKILPGVKINLTNKGISSASIGKQGASINIGKKGTRTSVGIPGSGLSYSKYQPYTNKSTREKKVANSYSNQEQPPFIETSSSKNSNSNVWFWIMFGIFCFIVGAIIF